MTPERGGPRRLGLPSIFVLQGTAGLALIAWATIAFRAETRAIAAGLGGDFWILVVLFGVTAAVLQLLRFELTRDMTVALPITVLISAFPLLGPVVTAWLGVVAVAAGRAPGILTARDAPTRRAILARIWGFFSTYGIPVLAAAMLYERFGGKFGRELTLSGSAVALQAACGLALAVANSVVMIPPGLALKLAPRTMAKLYAIDISIYLLTLPLSIVVTHAYGTLGWVAVLALMTQLVIAYAVTRKMAVAQTESRQLLRRLASLTNVGRAISLTTTDNLLMTVYTECKKVIDTDVFSIALLDEKNGDLHLELLIRNDEILPKQTIPPGQGLNHWVVRNHAPLLLARNDEERAIGIQSFDDGLPTQAWLGVPMIARDRVVGVVSVQSYKENAFSRDDVLLLTSIANQAAVAIDSAKLYEELEDLTYALEERVQERTNELRETNLQLMAADRAKNEFLAKMSHELRTPLNSIIGFSSVLIQTSSSQLPPTLYKFLENIHAAGNHLLNLINDILDLSKIEAGKVELRLETFDVRDTVASVDRVMRGFAAEANVTMSWEIDPDVPLVTLDEGRLKQILFNLLSNAVKFSPEGGPVNLAVRRLNRHDSPLGFDSIRIEVSDRGIGIPPAEIDRVFDEFYQADPARAARRSGTGLGLSLTKNFIELHHGTIEVQSEPGRGTIFTLVLPIDCRDAGILPPATTGPVRVVPYVN
ncbi:MAG: GAF domain-containing protein [Acidobacteria bacterium]|nr:GAF domain-containing protein [Acidobacteriota bacterium]